MSLKSIFTKPIDRPIDGVIKADDRDSLRIEIEEYVLTNEIEKRLEHFLDAYNNYEVANGVWISGFFGSGKSHLLKMLALLLENRVIDDLPVLDRFLPKCEKNAFLQGGFQQAAVIPSKSILFNIDQKADVISKDQIDALLAVFMFEFSDGSRTYGNFQDCDHFIQCYPFVPYQFGLFQDAIKNLSVHNAFEGKHSSVGERSMLGVFQEVAIKIQDYKIGQLATFDLMFEGISSALKSSIQKSILRAETDLEDKFALQLLKALFLVKYVREFKPTPRNLCVLMLDEFDRDLVQLRKQVDAGLSLLERETYIQRTGELYEYLTDEEKDIEQEIKNADYARILAGISYLFSYWTIMGSS